MSSNLDGQFIEMIDFSTRILYIKNGGKPAIRLCEEFKLKVHEGMPYLELKDISTQLELLFGEELLIDVWHEQGLNGYIYRYNSFDRIWEEHGKTRGFA